MPSGAKANVTIDGSITINNAVLRDVLCVPSFDVNLMSVGRTIDNLHCSVTFFPTWCVLQDLATRMMISVDKRRGDLYYLVALSIFYYSCQTPFCLSPHHLFRSLASPLGTSLSCSFAIFSKEFSFFCF